ncbi:DUF11 domain-containing protein [Chloroflexales bacterium ZM16-3]|nr:DUF11 domain-containing protein [Chloroflexales bacterium ZM16-3]
MPPSPFHHRVFTVLLMLLVVAGPFAARPAPAQAQVSSGSGFASAVPCLSATPTYATTTIANTIFQSPYVPISSISDPAIMQITASSSSTLVPVGASMSLGQNTPVYGGVGATYGLAYDDGSISGVRRLFAAAYLKRTVGLGLNGLGAIYAYDFATGSYQLAATVPNVGVENRPTSDTADIGMVEQVGKVGLGDLEVSPDGRMLYAMNLYTRQIERYDIISGGALVRQAPLAIPFGMISSDPAVLADLRPFAIGFAPQIALTQSTGPYMVVGVVDSAERSLLGVPTAYVLTHNASGNGTTGTWYLSLAQNLRADGLDLREKNSAFFGDLPVKQHHGWNSWTPYAQLIHFTFASSVRHPQPMLTDITFTRDGGTMFVGLRDRTGDQFFGRNAAVNHYTATSQGDVLTYKLIGGVWKIQGDAIGDFFDDNTADTRGETYHIENLMGTAAISMGGTGPNAFTEQLMTNSLLGSFYSGTRTYAATGGAITSEQTLNTETSPAGGKAASLGDVETLCTYALVGGRLWKDTDGDGVQDAGEPGFPNVAMDVFRGGASGALTPPLATLTTDAQGRYLFAVPPNTPVSIRIAASSRATLAAQGWHFVQPNVGGNDAADSDASVVYGYIELEGQRYGTVGGGITGVAVPMPQNRADQRTLDMGLTQNTSDVWVSKSGPAQALVGGTFSYTLSYGNAGALPAVGVQLVDTLPAGLTYVSASRAPSSVSGQTIRWNLGTLLAGQVGAITLTVRAPASIGAATSQAITNQASITTTTLGDPPANNSSSRSGTLVRPEVGITKSAPATALVGDELTYTLAYANSGSFAAASVQIADTLPAGVTLARFIQNPGGACSYTAATRRVSCTFASIPAGAGGIVVFAAKADVSAAASVANTATISTATTGDAPADNSATATTTVQFPNPGVGGISISPSPFPVGESGTVTATYRNTGTGVARGSSLTMTIPAGVTLGSLPSGCAYSVGPRTLNCPLGDLAAGASGSRVIPVSLPATFAADRIDVTATIATATPERPADQADNSAAASASVVRPNVFVTAAGPSSIVGQGSAFWYTLDYGNQYRANPSLTRAAEGVVLTATLPADVTYVSADVSPSSVSGQVLTWDLGTLAPNAGGQIHIVVQTDVPAGATLHFAADISTTTPGDDPSDNHAAVDTDVVQPPSVVSQTASDLTLAIHSDLDPNSQDGDATNGVYLSEGAAISWPAGEVLDFTPRLSAVSFPDEPLPFPYVYRARVVGWSVAGFTVNGAVRDPQAADSRGVAGCRAGARPTTVPQRLSGCAYAYLGGENRDAIRSPATLIESQLTTQAHAYWTQPPAPRMRNDVFLYTLDPLESVGITVQVEVEVWIVNAYPGDINGMPLPPIPVVPLPDPARQLIAQDFTVNLIVPRSVIAPGSR